MADENETSTAADTVEADTPATATEPKKKRAPRRTPAEMAAEVVAKASKATGRKKAAQNLEAKMAAASASAPAKAATKPAPKPQANAPVKAAVAPVAAMDEFADLLALEEENRGLRKSLSEKLRAENADLRKRLGQA
jgi:putative transposase